MEVKSKKKLSSITLKLDKQLILKLEAVISRDSSVCIKNQDIAAALYMSVTHFSNCVGAKSIPAKRVMDLCMEKKVNVNWVLENQSLSSQEDATESARHNFLERLYRSEKY